MNSSLIEISGSIICRDGKILLIHRKDEEHWEIPGGKVETNESPTEAAIREANEEIGVKVELKKPFYSGEFVHNGELYLWHCYLSELEKGEPETKEDKIDEVKWFEPEKLEDIDLAPNLEQILPALRNL